MAKLKSCLKIWGGKGSSGMNDWIVSNFPNRDAYHTLVDCCFGGGSITLAHDWEGKSEIAIDKNRMLTNFWRALQNPAARACLVDRLQHTPFSEIEFRDALAAIKTQCLDISEPHGVDTLAAVNFFIVARQSFVGRGDQFAALTKSRTRGGMNEQVSAWKSAVDRLSEVSERLSRVLILDGPFEDKIAAFDKPQVLLCIDPPYLPSTRTDPTAYGDNDTSAEWHDLFLARLQQVKHAKVVVCGNPNPIYDKGLKGWRKAAKKVADASSGAKTKRIREETLWMNY